MDEQELTNALSDTEPDVLQVTDVEDGKQLYYVHMGIVADLVLAATKGHITKMLDAWERVQKRANQLATSSD